MSVRNAGICLPEEYMVSESSGLQSKPSLPWKHENFRRQYYLFLLVVCCSAAVFCNTTVLLITVSANGSVFSDVIWSPTCKVGCNNIACDMYSGGWGWGGVHILLHFWDRCSRSINTKPRSTATNDCLADSLKILLH